MLRFKPSLMQHGQSAAFGPSLQCIYPFQAERGGTMSMPYTKSITSHYGFHRQATFSRGRWIVRVKYTI